MNSNRDSDKQAELDITQSGCKCSQALREVMNRDSKGGLKVFEFVRIFSFRYQEVYQADNSYSNKKGNEAPKFT